MEHLFYVPLFVFLVGFGVSSTARHGNNMQPVIPIIQEHINWNWTLTAQTAPQNSPLIRESSCGKKNASPELFAGRIAGGNIATPNEYPWQAFLQIYLSTGVNYHVCGGTLISNQWILTSASCVDGALSVNVYLGAHDVTATNEWHRVMYTSTVYTKNPRWNKDTMDGDLALVKLPVTINFSTYINSICLPSVDDPDHEGDTVFLTGWGRINGVGVGPISPVLRETTATVINNADCYRVYGNFVTNDIICSSGSGGRGICQSDYGGPMAYTETNGTFVQIGVASFYSILGCESGQPSGFTRLRNYVKWISEQTGTPIRNLAVPVIDSKFPKLLLVFLFVVQWSTY